MSRLIDADALLEGREDHEMISTHLIWNAPTIDAEPVKRGRWVHANPMVDTLMCSECGYNILGEELISNYCPDCGAKMDGERKEK